MEIKRFDETVTVDYPHTPGVKFKIRPITDKILLEIRARTKSGKVAVELPYPDPDKPGRNQIQIVDNYDDSRFEWETFKVALQGWEGISLGGDLNPTKDQMTEAIFNNRKMRRFILQRAMAIFEAENQILEEELKNLRDLALWIVENQNAIPCTDCKRVYEDVKKNPPCESCGRNKPNIHPSNYDAWKVYQLATVDASGINAQAVIEITKLLKIGDPEECFLKVVELTREIRKLLDSPMRFDNSKESMAGQPS